MTDSSKKSSPNSSAPSASAVGENQVEHSKTGAAKTPTMQKRVKNALTHGMYAEEIVLPWESVEELIKLRNELWMELQPEGRSEEETAVGIVRLYWLKGRLMRTSQLAFHQDPFATEVAPSAPKNWDELVKEITSASDDKASLTRAAKDSLEALKAGIEKIREINMACLPGHSTDGPPKEAFQAAQRAQSKADFVSKILTEQVFPRMTALEEASKSGAATVYAKAYSHEHLEKTLRIEASLDARIDKQMARLVSLKEYKRLGKETAKAVNEAVPLVPDQTDLSVGDTAKILITSPFQGTSEALITIERGDVIDVKHVTMESNSYIYEFKILQKC